MVNTPTKALLAAGIAGIFLSGCAAVVVEGAQATKSEVIISQNMEEAEAGVAEAQYKVGNAYCCSVHEGSGLYNTKTSVQWLCRSAKQDYAPAMLKLGKIYSGDVIDGVRVSRRVAQRVAGTSTNMTVAWAWLKLAADREEDNAAERAEKLWEKLDDNQRAEAQKTYEQGLEAPCDWAAVIGE